MASTPLPHSPTHHCGAELEDILNDNKKKFIEQLRQNQEELGKDIASLNEQVMSFVGCGQLEDVSLSCYRLLAITSSVLFVRLPIVIVCIHRGLLFAALCLLLLARGNLSFVGGVLLC